MPRPASTIPWITANNAMAQIAAINIKLQNNGQTDASTASLFDQRDQYIDQLSQLMDIRTVTNDLNQVTVFTDSGVQLVGTEASKLSFNPQGTITPKRCTIPIQRKAMSAPSPSTSRMVAVTTWCRPIRSARVRSPPISNCATRPWCRRRRRSISLRPRCRALCPTRRRAAPPLPNRRAAGGIRSRPGGAAIRQRRPRHLQGQHYRCHAQSLDRARR